MMLFIRKLPGNILNIFSWVGVMVGVVQNYYALQSVKNRDIYTKVIMAAGHKLSYYIHSNYQGTFQAPLALKYYRHIRI